MGHISQKNIVLLIISVIILLIAGFLIFTHFQQKKDPLKNYSRKQISIGTNKLDVWLADSPEKKEQGLAGVAAISDEQGMIFKFDQPGDYQFWMKGMLIPLDFIWIKSGQVVGITSSAQPEPGVADPQLKLYHADALVDSVLEVNDGWAEKHGVKPGSQINN